MESQSETAILKESGGDKLLLQLKPTTPFKQVTITATKTTAPRFIKVQAIKRPSCIRIKQS